MAARYVLAVTLGVAVTSGLLFLMHLLIDTGHGALTASRTMPDVAFVRVNRTPPPVVDERRPEKPREPPPKPDSSNPEFDDDFGEGIPVSLGEPTMGRGIQLGGPVFGASDGDYLPVFMVEPVYPSRARARDLEGYVLLSFTVTQAGTTRDVAVVESSSVLFERAAIESARKYKYRPRVVDGRPVEVPGVQALIRFELED